MEPPVSILKEVIAEIVYLDLLETIVKQIVTILFVYELRKILLSWLCRRVPVYES